MGDQIISFTKKRDFKKIFFVIRDAYVIFIDTRNDHIRYL